MSQYFDIEIKVNAQFDENVMKKIALEIKPDCKEPFQLFSLFVCYLILNFYFSKGASLNSQDDAIQIVCVRGGITNSLFATYLKSNGMNHADTILFRVYGENSEKFISRSNEIDTMCLMNEQGLGPRFYGRLRNGICYEYLPGSILDQNMVSDQSIYTKVAKAIAGLRKFHFFVLHKWAFNIFENSLY